MPSRLASTGHRIRAATFEPYLCPSCCWASLRPAKTPSYAPRRNTSRTGPSRSPWTRIPRRNVSLASATAINAPSTVPPRYRELHRKLSALQEEAGSFIDLSRIQLAARSLESNEPVIRVALLGLGANGALAATKLARVLLSDALSDEEAWEQRLLDSGEDGRSLLLRYGDREDVVQHSPLVQTVNIPSPYLKRHHLEILVTTLNADGRSVDAVSEQEIEDAILVPPLTTPTSAGGRVGFVRYPVHKALVVAEGITGAVEYGRLPRFVDKATLIHSALSLPLRSSTTAKSAEQTVTDNVVDIDLATHALDLFRTSRANGAQFSDEWQTSRIPGLAAWIAGPKRVEDDNFNFAVRQLLGSVLLNASNALGCTVSDVTTLATSATVPETKRLALVSAISEWAANAHRDLQLNLNTALSSYTWKRTVWWRLLWRIDDVSVSASDLLRLAWLTEAEQSLAFLSGRVVECGLATPQQLKEAWSMPASVISNATQQSELQPAESQEVPVVTPADLLRSPPSLPRIQEKQSDDVPLFDPPWPQTIHRTRNQMLSTLVPAFHRKAQTLLLGTLSSVGGTTALGAWIFVSFADLYSAGAIASLGLVWSLRRLQRLWGKQREHFSNTIREDGRKVLAEVESHLRGIVRNGGRVDVSAEDREAWARARGAVEKCQEVLEQVK